MAYSIICDYELASGLSEYHTKETKTVVRSQHECSDRPVAATQIASQESGFPTVYFSDATFEPVNNCSLRYTSWRSGPHMRHSRSRHRINKGPMPYHRQKSKVLIPDSDFLLLFTIPYSLPFQTCLIFFPNVATHSPVATIGRNAFDHMTDSSGATSVSSTSPKGSVMSATGSFFWSTSYSSA